MRNFKINQINKKKSTCLVLEGLPMFGPYPEPLLQALKKNKTVKHLSFANCFMLSTGCGLAAESGQHLAKLIKFQQINRYCESWHNSLRYENPQSGTMRVIKRTPINCNPDFGCGLAAESGHLPKLIKFQQINRYCESWHNSLRYENPQSGTMRGIKRITINCNPDFGDEGFKFILDELEDGLWIKALDLQRCNISENLAAKILDVIQYNRSLEIVDLRQNDLLYISTIEKVLQLLRDKRQFGSKQSSNGVLLLCHYSQDKIRPSQELDGEF